MVASVRGTSEASLDFGEEADEQRVNDARGQLAVESRGITVEAGKRVGQKYQTGQGPSY